MKAHIVGGGFGGLAAAACLIRNAAVPGPDITIYEAGPQMGGGFFLGGGPATGYNLPGSVFDAEFRCTFALMSAIPSATDPAVSVRDALFAFNTQHPYDDKAHVLDRSGQVVHSPRYGLDALDGFDLVRLILTPEALLEGRRIEEFFRPAFFGTEFWLLWSTIMGSLPQHSAAEFRRYMNRFVGLFPDLSDMRHVLRTPFNQHQFFIEPLVAWLRASGVTVVTGAFVTEVGFAPGEDVLTVERFAFERDGATLAVALAPDDLLLVTLGSQAEDMAAGSMTAAPQPNSAGRSAALWRRLAQARSGFGDPEVFFGAAQVSKARWVTLTVTTTASDFIDRLSALTASEPGLGGLVTLKDSSWVLSLSVFHQPEVLGQPAGTAVWWGYGLYPERTGDFIRKPMHACTGAEILEEVLRHLRFDDAMDRILATSLCVPCDMPFVNNIWLPRGPADRPPVVPAGSTNLGLLGQYVEMPEDIAFTIEYSARSAWEAVHRLLGRGPAPPPVYQGQTDPTALLAALRAFFAA